MLCRRIRNFVTTLKVVGLDPGFGSSPTGLCMCEFLKDKQKVIVRQSETFTQSDPNYVKDFCFDLYRKYWNLWFVVDGSNRAFVNLLKSAFGEPLEWDPKLVHPNAMHTQTTGENWLFLVHSNYKFLPSVVDY